jgi:hypothetical protein
MVSMARAEQPYCCTLGPVSLRKGTLETRRVQQDRRGLASPSPTETTLRLSVSALGQRIATVAGAPWRTTVRIVSWLTPNSAARARRLLDPTRAPIVVSWSGVSFRRRGTCADTRCDFPLTRRGGTGAISIGCVPGVS